ncbi:hypothetical protein GCM10023193_51170 [Planotetraspora kaengkrachanensis]|uniref:Uncharacterized protein n=1 Tax=Planotetraspora kaengkrachanensis TaxID=575193 RepID=A0A8J3PR87_9ACTN|nr:hypothetical protein Pka01_26880 [Planotetraspora kaengkrachanensis]
MPGIARGNATACGSPPSAAPLIDGPPGYGRPSNLGLCRAKYLSRGYLGSSSMLSGRAVAPVPVSVGRGPVWQCSSRAPAAPPEWRALATKIPAAAPTDTAGLGKA